MTKTAFNNKSIFWIDFFDREDIINVGTLDFTKTFWKNEWLLIADKSCTEIEKFYQ